MRFALYGGLSTLLAVGVIFNAMHQRSNFYAACVYLSKSSACIMILLNMGFLLAVCLGKTLQAIFFGSLRAIEVEHLYERSWYAVTETCLAMTIFREEFNLQFVIIFTTLLFIKIFHWLCQDRVEFMEQSPNNRFTFHVRMINLMALLLIVDIVLANHAIGVTMTKGPNMMVMFGFEYTILTCTILSTVGKYILNVIDLRSDDPWEGKSMYVFYLDLMTDFFKLITYIVFFIFICYYYQLPLHIIRDVYVTFRSFIQKCRDLYRYRRATRNMNELYPNATAEDFARMNDSTCIICREEMQPTNNNNGDQQPTPREAQQQQQDQPKKLPCGHIFHFHCLRSWLERQQSCPTCRRSVLSDGPGNNNSQAQQNQAQGQAAPAPAPAAGPDVNAGNQPTSPQETQAQQQAEHPPQTTDPFAPLHQHFGVPSSQQQQQQTSAIPPCSFSFLTPQHTGNGVWPGYQNGGMIPLIPLPGGQQQQQQQAGDNINPLSSSTLPESLTDEQLQILSNATRDAMAQRLRLLEAVQNQIYQSMQLLTQALSVIPSETRVRQQSDENGNVQTDAPKTETEPVQEEEKGEEASSSATPSSLSTSSIRKGKMKETSSSNHNIDDRTDA